MTTIRDIAVRLGLSTSTVSRALTDAYGVSEDTRQLVKRTAQDMNYAINRFAQNLVTRRSNTIGFLIPDISDSFFAKSAYGVEESLRNTPFTLAYTNVKRSPDNVLDYLRRAEEYCYAGAFVTIDDWTEAVVAQLAHMSIPVISLRRKTPAALASKIPYVDSNHLDGIEAEVKHLLALGHQRFGYIGFDTPVGVERAAAFKQIACKYGLDVETVSNFSYHNARIRISVGYTSAQKLMERSRDITALCAGDDQVAIGAMQYLSESGLRVPQDVSVCGYDDRDVAQLYCIQLTTVRQQLFEIGEQAGRMMTGMITRPQEMPQSLCVPTLLCPRKTTGPVRPDR